MWDMPFLLLWDVLFETVKDEAFSLEEYLKGEKTKVINFPDV